MPYFVKHSKQKIYEEMDVTGCDIRMSTIKCLLHHLRSLFFYFLGYIWNKLSFCQFVCVSNAQKRQIKLNSILYYSIDKELLMVVGTLCEPSKSAFVVKIKFLGAFK